MLYQLSYASKNVVKLYQHFFANQGILLTTHYIDARGLTCPEPLMLLKAKIRSIAAGDEVELLSEDPVSSRDVPAYCKFLGHELLATPDAEHPARYLIKKRLS